MPLTDSGKAFIRWAAGKLGTRDRPEDTRQVSYGDSLEKCPQTASWALVPLTPPSSKVKLPTSNRPLSQGGFGGGASTASPQPASAATARMLGLHQMPRVGGNPQTQPYSSPPSGAPSLGVASLSSPTSTSTGAQLASEPKPTHSTASLPSTTLPLGSFCLRSHPAPWYIVNSPHLL